VLVELEDGGDVAAPVAVVGRAPDRQNCLVKMPLVAFHDKLKEKSWETSKHLCCLFLSPLTKISEI